MHISMSIYLCALLCLSIYLTSTRHPTNRSDKYKEKGYREQQVYCTGGLRASQAAVQYNYNYHSDFLPTCFLGILYILLYHAKIVTLRQHDESVHSNLLFDIFSLDK